MHVRHNILLNMLAPSFLNNMVLHGQWTDKPFLICLSKTCSIVWSTIHNHVSDPVNGFRLAKKPFIC